MGVHIDEGGHRHLAAAGGDFSTFGRKFRPGGTDTADETVGNGDVGRFPVQENVLKKEGDHRTRVLQN